MTVQIVPGIICTKGIVVNDDIYSCSKAIREQWFLKAMDTGALSVIVYFDLDKPHMILLLIDAGYVPCLRITKMDVPDDYLQQYFDQMKLIKQKYRNSKRKSHF